MFITDFIRDPHWDQAGWKATTFGFDPKGAGPPYMGIVFGDADAARALFQKWIDRHGNADRWEAIRIAIIEDPPPEQQPALAQGGSVQSPINNPQSTIPPKPGYTIHLSCDPASLATDGQALSTILQSPLNSPLHLPSRICRAEPVEGHSPLLARFKQEYTKHKEYLLVPVTRRLRDSDPDAQLRVDLRYGIIKHQITFRQFADLDPTNPLDLDAQALNATNPPRAQQS